MNEIAISGAMKTVIDAITQDDSYRWSWWCNLVMPMIDAGATRETAERGAAQFLYNLSGGTINMYKDRMLANDRIDRYGQILLEMYADHPSDSAHGAIWSDIRTTIEHIKQRNGRDDLVKLWTDHDLTPNDENSLRRFGPGLKALFNILAEASNVLHPVEKCNEPDVLPA